MTDAWAGSPGRRPSAPDGAARRRVGKIFHLGKLPVKTQTGAYNNVARPGRAASGQLRAQVQLMFPK